MKKNIPYLSTFIALLLTFGCSSDSEDLNDIGDLENKVSYTTDIKGIIGPNCNSCHGAVLQNGAPSSLNNYNAVKNAVESLNLIVRIENGSMPPDGNLTQAQINLIKKWKSDGYLE